MFVFGEMFPFVEDFYNSGAMGNIKLTDYFNLSTGVIGLIIMVMAVGMFLGGEWLERKFREDEA